MSEFIGFLQELLEKWGPVTARRMFGGHGMYHDGLMFAIVVDQRLYLKTDAQNRPDFEARGLQPFTYAMKGKAVALSYWAAPDGVMDDPAEAVHWARSAWEAAARAQAAKAARPRRGSAGSASPSNGPVTRT